MRLNSRVKDVGKKKVRINIISIFVFSLVLFNVYRCAIINMKSLFSLSFFGKKKRRNPFQSFSSSPLGFCGCCCTWHVIPFCFFCFFALHSSWQLRRYIPKIFFYFFFVFVIFPTRFDFSAKKKKNKPNKQERKRVPLKNKRKQKK